MSKKTKDITLSTLNTRTGLKATPAKSYSSYWMDFYDDEGDILEDNKKPSHTERIVKLASIRRAIANFVRILTNDETIEVTFSSGTDSYTDGKHVVISADENSKTFDSTVGLALHEGAHCLLSDFNLNRNLIHKDNWFHAFIAMKPTLFNTLKPDIDAVLSAVNAGNDVEVKREKYSELTTRVQSMQRVLGIIMNIIEDRRIDAYIYKNASGYRPYYDAMYNKYFFNTDVTKNLKYNHEWRVPSVENYLNWLINIFHPNFDRNALPGLSRMVDIIDLKNINRFNITSKMPGDFNNWSYSDEPHPFVNKIFVGTKDFKLKYDELPLLWTTANDIFEIIIQHVADYENEISGKDASSGEEGEIVIVIGNGKSKGGVAQPITINVDSIPNLDIQDQSNPCSEITENGKFNKEKAQKAIDKIIEVMERSNRRKKLSRKEMKDIKNIEQSEAKIVEVGDKVIGKVPCLVTRKLTKQIMESSVFPFTSTRYLFGDGEPREILYKNARNDAAVARGIQMGQILVHRLSVRNDPQITHFTRQAHGKIDRRILAQLGMDIDQVFKRTTVENYKPVMLHLSLDASGSMSGKKWEKCLVVSTAMAYVASKIRSVDVVITIRGDSDIPIVAVVHDSRVDSIQKLRNIFPYLNTAGSTPEGLCFKATLDLILECTKTHDVYFVNFSDGEPGSHVRYDGKSIDYSGTNAYDHTRRQVQVMRDSGVKILSYFISDVVFSKQSQHMFKYMYGEDATFVNVQNVTDVLRTFNKLLLKKGSDV